MLDVMLPKPDGISLSCLGYGELSLAPATQAVIFRVTPLLPPSAAIDRQDAQHDYEVNVKAELEIELLHDKMNLLREEEVVLLVEMIQEQQQRLQRLEDLLQQPS